MGTWSMNLGNLPGVGYEHTQDPYLTQSQIEFQTGTEQWGKEFNETVRQFDASLAAQIEQYEASYAAQIQAAQIAAAASTGAADIHAQAAIRQAEISAAASRYNADTLMKIAKLDNETKYKIAQEANKLEAMKYEATAFQHPSKWAEQEAWFAAGGAPAIETPTRSVVPQMPGVTPVGSAAGSQAAGWTPAAPQAIVGEGGPEVATATPSGIDIQPLEKQQEWFLKKQGVPGMAEGGTFPWGGYKEVGSAVPASWRRQTNRKRLMAGQSIYAPIGPGGRITQYDLLGEMANASAPTSATPTATPSSPAAGGAASTATTPAATTGGEITPSVLSYLRGEEPMPSWGGQQLAEYQIPGGANYGMVPLPGSINLVDFLNLPYDLQQMYLSATEATYSMTPEQANQWMTRFSPRGIASPVATWG